MLFKARGTESDVIKRITYCTATFKQLCKCMVMALGKKGFAFIWKIKVRKVLNIHCMQRFDAMDCDIMGQETPVVGKDSTDWHGFDIPILVYCARANHNICYKLGFQRTKSIAE